LLYYILLKKYKELADFSQQWPGRVIPHTRTQEDGAWMDVVPNEAPAKGAENFAIRATD
jgi:hypothetical protein